MDRQPSAPRRLSIIEILVLVALLAFALKQVLPQATVMPVVTIRIVETPISQTPSALPQVLATTTTGVQVQNWVVRATPEPYQVAGGDWQNRPGLIDNDAWSTIAAAAALEPMCMAEFIYPLWQTESGQLDCTALLGQPGPNGCISSVGAKGPLQFMDGSWPEVAEPTWYIGNLHDSTRAACRMWAKMNLWSTISDRETFALRFSALDVTPYRRPQTWADRCWNCGYDGKNQAYIVWDAAQLLLKK